MNNTTCDTLSIIIKDANDATKIYIGNCEITYRELGKLFFAEQLEYIENAKLIESGIIPNPYKLKEA